MVDNPTEWFHAKTIELKDDLKKKGALLDLKSAVLNSEKKVLSEIASNVSLNPIFEYLNEPDNQDIELLCTIILEVLSELTGQQLLEKYGDYLHKCLLHSSDEVKGTILKLLEKSINDDTIEQLSKKHVPLLVDAAGALASPERKTAQGAISMFIKMGNSSTGLNALYSNLVLNKLKEVMEVNDTSRFRVYEIVVAVSKLSADNLSAGVKTGIMGSLIKEISSSDILIQLNALEMLSNLASSNHGLSYLQECNVIQNLVDKLLKLNEEPLSLVLLPGLIEFFGNLCALQPENFTKDYPQVMELLFNSLDTGDEVLLGVIISTVGKVGSTSTGKTVLNNYNNQMKYFFKRIGSILTTKNDLTVTAMNSLSELLKDPNGDGKFNEITKSWFDSITPSALDSIVNLSKLPFVEFRLAAFGVLKTIATQKWGTEKLSNYPGMIEFLTDRSTEFNKDCKQTKFEVVYNMVQCPIIEQAVSEQVLLNLKEFVKEGPFYVPVQVEMATEGAA